MESDDRQITEQSIQPTPIQQPPSLSECFFIPTLLAGVSGGGTGLLSKHRKVHPNIHVTYATNFAIVAACYCGARELVRVSRKSEHGDLMNSAIGGLFSGALLGRLQGGTRGALRYSIGFATLGTAFDYASLRAKPLLERVRNIDSVKLPVWFPIQILDEEALAKKKDQEQKLFAETALPRLNKEES
ncbi:hypothetical protein V5N11_009823 [Cardamine amara subsp. amara]|uniref:Uncharacterized protein n=1 Tax=Cardamine amara subsp. amara TaxID=228776 RepID=A0ABD1C7S3_CARAN